MSLLGVKQTCACAPHMSAFDPKRTCPSFTLILSEFTLKLLRSPCPGLGGENEATRFHHIDRLNVHASIAVVLVIVCSTVGEVMRSICSNACKMKKYRERSAIRCE